MATMSFMDSTEKLRLKRNYTQTLRRITNLVTLNINSNDSHTFQRQLINTVTSQSPQNIEESSILTLANSFMFSFTFIVELTIERKKILVCERYIAYTKTTAISKFRKKKKNQIRFHLKVK